MGDRVFKAITQKNDILNSSIVIDKNLPAVEKMFKKKKERPKPTEPKERCMKVLIYMKSKVSHPWTIRGINKKEYDSLREYCRDRNFRFRREIK